MAKKPVDHSDIIHKTKMDKLREETAQKIAEIDAEMQVKSRYIEMCRARAISVGTAFGGVVEITLKDHKGDFSFAIMQPVEVVEFIHTLASNIGCSVDIRPRADFASWRTWNVDPINQLEYKHRHPPHPNDQAPFVNIGAYGGNDPDRSLQQKLGTSALNDVHNLIKSSEDNVTKLSSAHASIHDLITNKTQEENVNDDSMAVKKNING